MKIDPFAHIIRPVGIWRQVSTIAVRDPGGKDTFRKLGTKTSFSDEAARNIVIVVYPGDAIEHYLGPEVAAWSQANQTAMAAELEAALDAGNGVVVIHRASSTEFRANAVVAWRDAVRRATDYGVVLYGDGVTHRVSCITVASSAPAPATALPSGMATTPYLLRRTSSLALSRLRVPRQDVTFGAHRTRTVRGPSRKESSTHCAPRENSA